TGVQTCALPIYLDGVNQRQIRALVGRHRDLQLGVQIRPDDPLLLHTDAGVAREVVDELVHDLAVRAGEPVPVGDGRLRLGRRAARAQGERGGAERGTLEEATATRRKLPVWPGRPSWGGE